MHPCHDLALLLALAASCMAVLREFALRTSQGRFLGTKEARVGDFFPGRQIRERLQSNINPNRCWTRWQTLFPNFFLFHLATERNEPFAGGCPFDNGGIKHSLCFPLSLHVTLTKFCRPRIAPHIIVYLPFTHTIHSLF